MRQATVKVKEAGQDQVTRLVDAFAAAEREFSVIACSEGKRQVEALETLARQEQAVGASDEVRNAARTAYFVPRLEALLKRNSPTNLTLIASVDRDPLLTRLVAWSFEPRASGVTLTGLVLGANLRSLHHATYCLDNAANADLGFSHSSDRERLLKVGTLGFSPVIAVPVQGRGSNRGEDVFQTKYYPTLKFEVSHLLEGVSEQLLRLLISVADLFERRNTPLPHLGNPPGGRIPLSPKAFWRLSAHGRSAAADSLIDEVMRGTDGGNALGEEAALVVDCIAGCVLRNRLRFELSQSRLNAKWDYRETDHGALEAAVASAMTASAVGNWNSLDGPERNRGYVRSVLSTRCHTLVRFESGGIRIDEPSGGTALRHRLKIVVPNQPVEDRIAAPDNYLPLAIGIIGKTFGDLVKAEAERRRGAKKEGGSPKRSVAGSAVSPPKIAPSERADPEAALAAATPELVRCIKLQGAILLARASWKAGRIDIKANENLTVLGLVTVGKSEEPRVLCDVNSGAVVVTPSDLLKRVDNRSLIPTDSLISGTERLPANGRLTQGWAEGVLEACKGEVFSTPQGMIVQIGKIAGTAVNLGIAAAEAEPMKYSTRLTTLVAFHIVTGNWSTAKR